MYNPSGGRISDHMYPFYRVFDEKGEQYCDCSHEEYAIKTLELHDQKFTYRKINAPKPLPPHIIDVNAETDGELPGQRGLPESKRRLPFESEQDQHKECKLKEIELNYD